jgi:tetratricopeptide (TPR) repeat protein
MKSYQQIRCQRCRAVNPLGEELCGQCGTRLMLVVEPTTLRFEEDALATGPQEGLVVERLSMMEHNLTRMIGNLERSTELMGRHTQIMGREHMLIEALVTLLGKAGLIDLGELQSLWDANCARSDEEARLRTQSEELCAAIVKDYAGPAVREFTRLVEEGFAALAEKDGADGWRMLERAAALAPQSGPLNALLGRRFFQTGKVQLARSYLERAFAAGPANSGICLLLALARGDEGDAAGAHTLLLEAERLGGAPAYALHYAHGRLFAHAGRWRDALASFKRALAAHDDEPEAHYLVALAAYRLNFGKLALQHADKALARDKEFAAAVILRGLVLRKSGDAKGARAAFAEARAMCAQPNETPSQARSANRFTDELLFRHFFGFEAERRQLMTGGDERLAALLRRMAAGC